MIKKNLETERKWQRLRLKLKEVIGKKPRDLNSLLLLIGIQELGKGSQAFSKEQKQDLMHIAVCKLLSLSGYYTLEGLDKDGWPHWKKTASLPHFDIVEQEYLLKLHILEYFEDDISLVF